MSYSDAFDKLMERSNYGHVVLAGGGRSLAASVVAAMETAAALSMVTRDLNHPRFRDKVAPSSPRQSFKKSSKR